MTNDSTKQQQQQNEYYNIPSCQALYELSQCKKKKRIMVKNIPDMISRAISDILKMNTTTLQKKQEEEKKEENQPLSISNATQSLNATLYSIQILIDLLHPMFHHEHLFHDPDPTNTCHADTHKKKNSNQKKKMSCFLFISENVYGITTVKRCKSLVQRYTIILDVFRDYHSKPLLPNKGSTIQKRVQQYHLQTAAVWNQDKIIQQTLSLFFKTGSRISRERIRFIHQMDATFQSLFQTTNATIDKDIQYIQNTLSTNIARHCNGTRLSIYGSCCNRLCLGKSFDIDFSLDTTKCIKLKADYVAGKITSKKYNKDRISYLYKIRDIVRKIPGVQTCILITHARVPVIKGTFQLKRNNNSSNIEFDICLMNHVAVANSALIREYCNVGTTTHKLLLLVKMWAKTQGICSAAEGTVSSYSWIILAIFYLQTIGHVPNLQNKHWQIKQAKNQNENHKNSSDATTRSKNRNDDICLEYSSFQMVKQQQQWVATEKAQNLPLSALFYGFLKFYSQYFPLCSTVVSIRTSDILPKTVFARSARLWRFCIEDPFETFESCRPHDLGMHISEIGQSCINHAFWSTLNIMELVWTKKIKYDPTYEINLKRQFHYHCAINALKEMKQLQRNNNNNIDTFIDQALIHQASLTQSSSQKSANVNDKTNDDKISPENSEDAIKTVTQKVHPDNNKTSRGAINIVTEKLQTNSNHNKNNKEITPNRMDTKKRKMKRKKKTVKSQNPGKQRQNN